MYYKFKTTVDLKKESNVIGEFSIIMPFLEVIMETKVELTDAQIETVKNKISTMMSTKFGFSNFVVELINVIK